MSLATVVRSESKLLLPTYDRQRVLFERGRGVYLWDSMGKRYLAINGQRTAEVVLPLIAGARDWPGPAALV